MFKQLSFTSTLILAAAFSAAAAAIAAPPQTSVVSIGFDHNAVVVSGITPGGRAVLFGVARERTARKPSSLRFVRRAEILVDAAKTGTVTFDLGESVPAVAIWAAIDLTSGGYTARPSVVSQK